jgi:hypothetical protein
MSTKKIRAKGRAAKLFCVCGCLAVLAGISGCSGFTAAKDTVPAPASTGKVQITTTSLPAATISQNYTVTLGASGGVAPYTWSVAASQMPSGFALNGQTGAIAGMATAAGTYNLKIGVADSSPTPLTASATLTLKVNPAAVQTLQITSGTLPNATDTQAYSAPLTASGGTAPLHWSVKSGQLPSGINLNASSGMLSGTPTQSGGFSFVAEVSDSETTPQVATKSLTLTAAAAPSNPSPPTPPSNPAPPSSSSGGSSSPAFYGSGIGSDGLSNLRIGPDGYTASYRFQATHTGKLSAIHFYLIVDKTGYSGGNGGEIQVNLETDDGSSAHNPSGKVLASYTITSPQSAGASGSANFPIVTFSSPVSVTEGSLYHIVFSNPSSDPTDNFVSVDDIWHSVPSNPVQPTENETDFAVLLSGTGLPWTLMQTHTPILETDYTDGTTSGNGYMEVWIDSPQPIGGNNAVRETFTNSGENLAVTSVSVRVARTAGSAPLTVRLEQSDGNLIEQGTVASTALPLTTTATYTWVTYTFSAVRTLLSGQGYNLVLEAPSGTTYMAYPIRKGNAEAFASTTYFPDGYAQFNQGSNSTWVGWTEWGVTNRTDGDLQFYFTTTP